MSPKENSAEVTTSKWALPIVWFTVFIDLLGFSIVIPILAPLMVLQTSPILPTTPLNERLIIFGFLLASYAIAQFFAAPIIGQLSDRFGRKPLLAISLIGTLISRSLFIYGIISANIYLLFFSRILDGITGGNISVAQSSVADISTPQNRAKNFGLIGAAFGLGFIIGPYLGGKLAEPAFVDFLRNAFGGLVVNPTQVFSASTAPLLLATVLCALNIISVAVVFQETIKEKIVKPLSLTNSVTNIVKAFRVPNLRITFITIFLLTFGFTFFTQFLTVYIGNKFAPEIVEVVENKIKNKEVVIPANLPPVAQQGIKNGYIAQETQKQASDVFSYIGLWVVIAQGFVARALGKRFKATKLLSAGLIVLAIVSIVLLIPAQSYWLFFILPIFALANGITQPNSTAIVSNSADGASQGEVLGINTSVQALAQAIPPIVSGFVTSLALQLPILMASVCFFAAFAVFTFLYKEKSKTILHEE